VEHFLIQSIRASPFYATALWSPCQNSRVQTLKCIYTPSQSVSQSILRHQRAESIIGGYHVVLRCSIYISLTNRYLLYM